jgi:SAM-dependent methyltransferase
MNKESTSEEKIREVVREGYARVATQGESCCGGSAPEQLAESIGYSEADLAGLPEGANMGLSCGNPTALAELREGEVVLDLGAGGGFDVFLAGPRVGSSGRAIGIDMTAEMLAKARGGIAAYRERTGLANVEFRLGEIEHLPVADASVDAVISNCVINLSPDKPQVWREIGRVLRPGGRVAVSDLALLKPLPVKIREMVAAMVGCLAGAISIDETERAATEAGLIDVRIEPKPGYVETMTEWKDPLWQKVVESLPEGSDPADYVASVNVTARRPG